MTVERLELFAATLTHLEDQNDSTGLVELGTRVLKTGQIAKWGKHLKGDLPFTYQEGTKGVFQIHDPATKGFITVNRSRDKLGANAEQWWKHKNAYISDLRIPKKSRNTLAGGKALKNFFGDLRKKKPSPSGPMYAPNNPAPPLAKGKDLPSGLFPHFDRRGITSRTTAGAFQQSEPTLRQKETGRLVRGYQEKYGFKIDPKESSNPYNVSMVRKPNAQPQVPISDENLAKVVSRNQRRAITKEVRKAGSGISDLAPGLALGATGTVISASAAVKPDNKSTTSREIIGGVLGVGGAAAIYRNRAAVGKVVGSVGELLAEGRVIAGHRISKNFPRVSKQVLRGFVGV